MLILASQSPRREELLRGAGFSFEIIPPDADENIPQNCTAEEAAVYVATQKAQAVAEDYRNDTVIGADTIVVLNGEIMGKPKDMADAFRMLSLLSGKTHTVITGVCVIDDDEKICFSEITEVEFYPLSEEEIIQYIATGEPLDKAGAYGIQEKGALLVKRINGDYFNVVGLPIGRLNKELLKIT